MLLHKGMRIKGTAAQAAFNNILIRSDSECMNVWSIQSFAYFMFLYAMAGIVTFELGVVRPLLRQNPSLFKDHGGGFMVMTIVSGSVTVLASVILILASLLLQSWMKDIHYTILKAIGSFSAIVVPFSLGAVVFVPSGDLNWITYTVLGAIFGGKNGVFIAILAHVDDIVISGNNEHEIDKFKKFLSSKFMIKELGLLKYFFGIEVLENKNGMCLTQRKYCLELLCEYGLLACKPAATPLQQNVVLNHVETHNVKFLPNIQHMHAPLKSYFTATLRVLRYLKNAPSTGVQFYKGKSLSLHAYSDADWAKCLKTKKLVFNSSGAEVKLLRFASQLHESAGGLPKTNLCDSCSLAGRNECNGTFKFPLHSCSLGREHECNESFKTGAGPPALSWKLGSSFDTMSVIGFDIGNENCVVAAAKRGGIDVLLNDEAKRETPGVVSFGDKQRFLGSAGASFAAANPKSTISQIKRLIGRQYKEPSVQEDLKFLPFVTREGPRGGILIEVEYMNEKMTFTPVEILGMLFKHLKQLSEKNLESAVVDCVIGIPSYFTDLQRREYLDAAAIAGLKPLALMHDGTATALGYGMYKTDLDAKPIVVVFVDIGHSDTQVTVAFFEQGEMNILAHSFDQNLGGRDFDEVLFKHFAAHFKKEYNIDVYSNARACIRLKASCEKLKKVLSANTEAPLSIECLIEDKDVRGIIMREEFENLSQQLLGRVTDPCLKAIEDSRISVDKIYTIELVGSGSRIPAITKMLTSLFEKEPTRTLNASECVARGCALRCAMLSPTLQVRDYEVLDLFPYSILLTINQGENEPHKEITSFEKGMLFPSIHTHKYHGRTFSGLKVFYTNTADLPAGLSPKVGHFTTTGLSHSSGAENLWAILKFQLNRHGIFKIQSVSLLDETNPRHKIYWSHPEKIGANSRVLNLQFSDNLDVAVTKDELITAQEREKLLAEQDRREKDEITKSLQETEDWLYEDSDDESDDQDYTGKLDDLKKVTFYCHCESVLFKPSSPKRDGPLDSEQRKNPVESEQRPVDSEQRNNPVDSEQRNNPVDSEQRPADSEERNNPVDSDQKDHPVNSVQRNHSVESDQKSHPVNSDQKDHLVDSNRVDRPMNSNRNIDGPMNQNQREGHTNSNQMGGHVYTYDWPPLVSRREAGPISANHGFRMSVIGFDIGNVNCVIAAAKRGGIDVLLNDEAKRESPGVVSFGDKQRFMGSAGAAFATANPKSTISQIKRLIGRQYNEPSVQEELKLLPFVTSEGPRGGIMIELEYMKEKLTFSPVEILGMLFKHLKQIAEKSLESAVLDCVIGIPSYFTDLQRREYLDAAFIAGLNTLLLMHDGTAIALGYGMYKTDLSDNGSTIVVFVDIGHCDTQVTVAAFERGGMKVLSHASDQNLGGRDFDEVLFKHFADKFKEQYNIDVYSNTRACIRLRASCEKLKKVLSANTEAPLSIECLIEDKDVRGIITREEFENHSRDLLDRVAQPCIKAVNESGINPNKIYTVELVGSGSRVPAITKILSALFYKEPTRTLNASECVARGCALRCAMLSPTQQVRDYEVIPYYSFAISGCMSMLVSLGLLMTFGLSYLVFLLSVYAYLMNAESRCIERRYNLDLVQDCFPYSIGARLDEGKNIKYHTVTAIPKGSPFPVGETLKHFANTTFYFHISYINQIDLPAGVSPKVGLFMMGPSHTSGAEEMKVLVRVELNKHGIVEIRFATELEDERPSLKNVLLHSIKTLAKKRTSDIAVSDNLDAATTKDELLKAQEREQKLLEQDKKVEQTKDQRNTLESFVYDTRNKLQNAYKRFVTDSENEGIIKSLQETEDWLYEDSDDECDEQIYTGKLEDLKKLLEPIESRYKDENKVQATKPLLAMIEEHRLVADSLPVKNKMELLKKCTEVEQLLSGHPPENYDPIGWSNFIKKTMDRFKRMCEAVEKKAQATKPLLAMIEEYRLVADSHPLESKTKLENECAKVEQYLSRKSPENYDLIRWSSFINETMGIFKRRCEEAMQYKPSSPEHPGPVESGRSCNHMDSQIGKPMDAKQTGKSMDGNRTGKSMDGNQTGDSMDTNRTGNSMNRTGKPVERNQTSEPVERNQTSEPVERNQTSEPVERNQTSEPVESNQTSEQGQTSEPMKLGQTTEPVKLDQPVDGNQTCKPVKPDPKSEPVKPDETSKPVKTEQTSKTVNMGKVDKPFDSEQMGIPDHMQID
ncbi:heat shock 70 kDa protein 16 [Tanacetum coccineum]